MTSGGAKFANGLVISGASGVLDLGGTQVKSVSNIELTDCTISNGSSTNMSYGGAITGNGNCTFSNCTFAGNSAGGTLDGVFGGAVTPYGGSFVFSNCVFASNYAQYGGAVEPVGAARVFLTGCTFSNNSASQNIMGAAVFMHNNASATLTISNCFFGSGQNINTYNGSNTIILQGVNKTLGLISEVWGYKKAYYNPHLLLYPRSNWQH